MSSLLSVNNLSVKFTSRNSVVTAVDDFSLTIGAGECVGLVGESGCGKTTTGLSVMRLLPGNGRIAAGNVVLNGVDLATLSEREMQKQRGSSVALIPQDPMSSLNPTTKIGRQIGEGLRIHKGASDEEARKRALEVLEMVEMPNPAERLDQYPFELSGGLRQRVIIAMGLVCEPKLLIADEPTTALDVTIQAQILDILDNLRNELGMAMLLITHDMGVIAGRADRVVVMYGGKKAEEGPTIELFHSMRHPYTQALLASVPNLENTSKHELASIPGMPPNLAKEIVGCRFAPRCAYATDQCRIDDPPFVVDDQRGAACFHPRTGPLPIGPRTIPTLKAAASGSTKNELVRVSALVKEFPIKGGLIRQLHSHRGRDLRTRRRVGLRQDHDRAHDGRPRALDGRRDLLRWSAGISQGTPALSRRPSRTSDDVSRPLLVARSTHEGRSDPGRAAHGPASGFEGRAARTRE
jgi:peptide/nickel transport system ATP-binding protein